jgi:hypothetical protein
MAMAKGATMGNEKPEWLPIGKITTVRGYIEEALTDAKERLATLEEAVPKPHVTDDALLDRVVRVNKKILDENWLYRGQLDHWLGGEGEGSSPEQRIQIGALHALVDELDRVLEANISLAGELRKGSIDRIMEMDDIELAVRTLTGEIGRPKGF